MLSSGNKLNFYQYELPSNESTADDVKRLQQRGLYKLLQSYEHPGAHHIPSFCFHNSKVLSHIGVLSGSNKELIVYDSNENKAIRSITDNNYKHPHTVKFYEGAYAAQDPTSLNTFLTASADSIIKLWDLRVSAP